MISLVRNSVGMPVLAAGAAAIALVARQPDGQRDGIGDLMKRRRTPARRCQSQAATSLPARPPSRRSAGGAHHRRRQGRGGQRTSRRSA